MPLSGKIPKQVEEMFSDPVDYFKKQIKPSIQTFEFHKSQQKRLHRHNQQKLKFLEGQIGEAKKFISQAKQIEKEFKRLKAENEYFKSLINKEAYPKGTPIQRHKSPNSRSPHGSIVGGGRSRSPHGSAVGSGGNRDRTTPIMQRSMPGLPTSGGRPASSQQIRLNSGIPTNPGFNGRLLVRSPPEGGQLGSIRNNYGRNNYGLNQVNRLIAGTPDSGYNDSGADTPLTVPRPINFEFSSQDSIN